MAFESAAVWLRSVSGVRASRTNANRSDMAGSGRGWSHTSECLICVPHKWRDLGATRCELSLYGFFSMTEASDPAPASSIFGLAGSVIHRHDGGAHLRRIDDAVQCLTVRRTRRQFGPILQNHDVLPMKPRLQLLDPIDVDDRRPVHAHKPVRSQSLLQPGQRVADDVRFTPHMQNCMLAVRLNPVDLTRLEKRHLAPRADDESIDRPFVEEAEQVTLGGASQSLVEPLRLDRLQQIVDRVHIERLHRVFIVRRHENDCGQPLRGDGLQHFEAIEVRHLNVEEYEIGPFVDDRIDRFAPSAALPDDRDTITRFEERADTLAGERFVVDDEGARPRHCGEVLNGIWILTVNPPFTSVSTCAGSPYRRATRSRVFASPMPLVGVPETRPGPSSDTSRTSEPAFRRARTVTWPMSGRSAMPCVIAFSTIGCSTRLGTSASRTSGPASTVITSLSPNRTRMMSR